MGASTNRRVRRWSVRASCSVSTATPNAAGDVEEGAFNVAAVCRGVRAAVAFVVTCRARRVQSSVFESPKVVVWRRIGKTGYTLILEPHENIALASHALAALDTCLTDHFKNPRLALNPKEVRIWCECVALRTCLRDYLCVQFLVRPEEVILVIQQLLPSGGLSVLTPVLLRQKRRQVDALLK